MILFFVVNVLKVINIKCIILNYNVVEILKFVCFRLNLHIETKINDTDYNVTF